MVWAAHRGAGGVSIGSGWRKEGERDPQSVGWLGRLVARWVGPKGQNWERHSTGLELKRNSF
jgi:hypothetical protein